MDVFNILIRFFSGGAGFDVDDVHIAALRNGFVQGGVLCGGDGLVAALDRGSEGEKKRRVTQGLVQKACGLHGLFDVHDVLIKVHPPLDEIHGVVLQLRGFLQDPFAGLRHDGDDDLRRAGAHLEIPNHHSIHFK